MNKTQKAKRKVRSSKAWKTFKHNVYVKQHGIDPITKTKLGKGATLHHRNLTDSEEEYGDFSNEEDYVLVHSSIHRMLHLIFSYWEKDPSILDRIEEELQKWHRGKKMNEM